MLFLGSKDMNVYLIDISKGKLCVVYEGHWSRVNLIKQVENKDLLLTVSESNIKIWDLEYDECIKNMNEHTSPVVYCESCHHNKLNIVTIS
jgi:WD40 repeat protein